MTKEREKDIQAMAIAMDMQIDEMRKIFDVIDKAAEEHDLSFDQVVEIVIECNRDIKDFGLTPEEFRKLLPNIGNA